MDKLRLKTSSYAQLALSSLLILFPLMASGSEESKAELNNSTENSSFHIKIVTQGSSPLQKLTLNETIYLENQARLPQIENSANEHAQRLTSKKRRLRDRLLGRNPTYRSIERGFDKDNLKEMLTVRDASGSELPFVINDIKAVETTLSKPTDLYPLYERAQLLSSTDKLSFKYNQQNQLQEISSEKLIKHKAVIGYLIDLDAASSASQNRRSLKPASTLSFELSKVSQTSFLKFSIDQSNDLKNWRKVSSNEVLAQLVQAEQISQKNTTSLSGINSRYLRMSLLGSSPSFAIKSATQSYAEYQAIAPIWSDLWQAQFDDQEEAMIVELSPEVTYTALRFNLENSLSIMRGNIFAKSKSTGAWYPFTNFDVFHIKDGEQTIINDPISLAGLNASHLKIKFDSPNNINNINHKNSDSPINLSLAWRPQQLTFLSNGNAPYEIVIESRSDKKQKTNDERIIAKIKSQLTSKVGSAQYGESYLVAKPPLEKPNNHWPKTALWIALIAGLLMMLWMVKKMFGQLK